MARGDRDGNNSVTLGPRDSLIGNLTIDGDLTIHGKVEGELHATGDVAVTDGATVRAQVDGNNVTVHGTLTGNVNARGKLTLAGSGNLQGDVRVAKLSVDDGATLNGNVSMGQSVGGGRGPEPEPEPQYEAAPAEGQPAEEQQPDAVG